MQCFGNNYCIFISCTQDNIGELELFDEQATRTATLLSLFGRIITCSPACCKKSLCALFLFLDEANQHIDYKLIDKVGEFVGRYCIKKHISLPIWLNRFKLVENRTSIDILRARNALNKAQLLFWKSLTSFYSNLWYLWSCFMQESAHLAVSHCHCFRILIFILH